MPSRKYVTPIEQLQAKAREIIKANNDSRFLHRVECVNFVLNGMTPSALSEMVHESKNTITSWVKTADEKGFDALRIKEYPGRPKKLQDDALAEIKAAINDEPEQYGFRVWDGPSLAEFINSKYNVGMSVRQCQRLFHELGFALIRPRTMPTKGEDNQEKRAEFKKNYRAH